MAEETKVITQELTNAVNNLLSSVNLDDVTAENNQNFEDLPEGYYLCEVVSAKLTVSKSSGEPMVAFKFKTCEQGRNLVVDDSTGNTHFEEIKGTENRQFNIYYVLKDEKSLKRFVGDMLKFEGEVEGEPLLGKEYFTNSELLVDALDILVGMRLYIQISISENKDGTTSRWQNPISWKRAAKLELPN